MNVMPISAFSQSDKGRVREINEDSVAVLEKHGLVILADGMGGYNAGEVASQLAVESITANLLPHCIDTNQVPSDQVIATAVEAANEAILSMMMATPEYDGMATTVVMGLFHEGRIYYGHVGDSRLYRLRAGQLKQMTKDHSMIQAVVDEGMFASIQEALDAGVKGNILIRGLGINEIVQVDVASDAVVPGDVYLFCSDGLSNMVSDQEMQRILIDSIGDMESAAKQLLDRALERGGLDNISLAVVSPH
ncbi:MAG: serine/threonine-protein phosphatase [Sedimenticola thiotaurini]|uniref:Serine/threonine-protein phosphatase n=1 Tax=Sedimenticola thiotaurini TaxID=1543721 RepID=A0A558CSE7_9GAMM|nr:MAG: serine/threonine-protein phosphatase [Sedimenticola thiotaurini]